MVHASPGMHPYLCDINPSLTDILDSTKLQFSNLSLKSFVFNLVSGDNFRCDSRGNILVTVVCKIESEVEKSIPVIILVTNCYYITSDQPHCPWSYKHT